MFLRFAYFVCLFVRLFVCCLFVFVELHLHMYFMLYQFIMGLRRASGQNAFVFVWSGVAMGDRSVCGLGRRGRGKGQRRKD